MGDRPFLLCQVSCTIVLLNSERNAGKVGKSMHLKCFWLCTVSVSLWESYTLPAILYTVGLNSVIELVKCTPLDTQLAKE